MSLSIPTVADPLPRVLLVSSTLDEDGGVPVCVGQLAEGLAGLGVPVGITGQHAGPLGAVIAGAGRRSGVTVEAVSAPWHPRGQWDAARRVRAVVRATAALARAEGRFLVVHVHGVWVAPVIAAAAAAVDVGATLVVSPHGMLRQEALRKSPWRKWAVWEGWLRRRLVTADAIHVTSPLEGEELAALLPGCRPVLVPLGIVPPADAPRGRARGAPRRAGYLGRILPIKNLDILLRAWKLARPSGWRLAIDGPGPAEMTASLHELAERLGIGSEVEIGGAVPMERLGEHFASLDLFVLPSRSEAFALTVGEALACGVPAVVTTAAPWGDVERMACGWSVAPTVAGLAEALSLATALPSADLEVMGRRGRDWVRADYAWSEVARRHVSELYDVRGETRSGSARA
jgi:glycosyltransferase involved in cell wall biosynthesis